MVPSTFFFELLLGVLRGWGRGEGAPGTLPLQNAKVTSRKACLRNGAYRDRNGCCTHTHTASTERREIDILL